MTTITFGGGPTIEARRKFSNLKSGSQVPGYCGYIHQIKYNSGHTYGDETGILANKFPDFNRSKTEIPQSSSSSSNGKSEAIDLSLPVDLRPRPKYTLSHDLPKPVGGNKLTESMVPGYTGYIPSRKFHFSDTYRAECDQCIDDFMGAKDHKSFSTRSLVQTVRGYEGHTAIAPNPEIKHNMDHFRDTHPNDIYLQSDKRVLTEAPMPGYTGHVPRIVPTELGLGARFHETTKRGFEAFKGDYLRRTVGSDPRYASADSVNTRSADGGRRGVTNKRLYVPPGMVPKYTGYIHGLKYQFGNTYGEATRQMPVCNHDNENFGVYMTENPAKSVIC